jgi:hypothetical protein
MKACAYAGGKFATSLTPDAPTGTAGDGAFLAFVASRNEAPSIIENDVANDCWIKERRVCFVYDRSGAGERDIERVYVDLLCIKQAVIFSEILNSKFHAQPVVACG